MFIGNVEIKSRASLAPMAGASDRAFREVCRSFGAGYAVGEMVSAKGLSMGSRRSAELLVLGESEHPAALQLFADDPQPVKEAARLALSFAPDVLDLNMGCPAPKIAGGGSGAALMKDPQKASDIIKAVVAVSSVPVTVKFRKGWDDGSVNAVEFAQMCEQSGAAAVCIHGRTRAQMYAPPVDLDIIRRVKLAVKIPVIGNGDIVTPMDALVMYEETGCDIVAVGRGALGRPWLFRQIEQYFDAGSFETPALPERMAVLRRQAALMVQYKGERTAMREARKHCGWYLTGIRGAAALRREACMVSSLADIDALIARVLAENVGE